MFDGKYFEWNQKRIKAIIDYYGYKFFYGKKVADLGCGYADVSGALYRLGSEVSAVDARQEHLKVVTKKYSGIKVVRANLDGPWPFSGQKFDLVLDLGLLCHLASFEDHLKAVCASTMNLVLETAVCDSDDPDKCVQVPEGKDVYDLAYNGMGCRPTSAAIEKVLTNCGMTFKRMDSSKFNAGDFSYDWQPQNDSSTNLNKRRIWFAVKTSTGIELPDIAQTSVVIHPPRSEMAALQNSMVPSVLTASPKPPMDHSVPERPVDSPPTSPPANQPSQPASQPTSPPPLPATLPTNYVELNPSSLNFQVKKNSKEFAIISPEDFVNPNTFATSGIIWTNSPGSRRWLKKIFQLFPNIKVSSKSHATMGFPKTNDAPNLIMCSINSLIPNSRVWIEEWYNTNLTPEQIGILNTCPVILTPSLINAQEILKALPSANVQRIERPWPMINVDSTANNNYFLYFEKSPELTSILYNSWNDRFGRLAVVGSSLKTPPFANFFADTIGYRDVMRLLKGARAVIDLSENNYYMSGIIKLSHALSLPVITNNMSDFNSNNPFIVEQDKTIAPYPTANNIQKTIDKFLANNPAITPAQFNEAYNNDVDNDLRKLLGV